MVTRAQVQLVLDEDEAATYRLPGSGTPSMLFVFAGQQVGALAKNLSGPEDFQPGRAYDAVELTFLYDEAAQYAVEGAQFVVWYGRDIGRGHVTSAVP